MFPPSVPPMSRRHHYPARLLWALLLLPAVAALFTACGHSHPPPPPFEGEIVIENRTDLTTNELVMTFFVAPFGQPWTGDLLGGPLPILDARSMGIWPEDHYDAEADMELGTVVEWFDLFVGLGDTTVFVAE